MSGRGRPDIARKGPQFWYAEANRLYFNGALPKITVRWGSDKEIRGNMARTYYGKGWKPLRIVINRAFKKWPANACMHLLHEMAHVSVVISGDIGKPHGKTWRAVMMRLARAGAMKHIW